MKTWCRHIKWSPPDGDWDIRGAWIFPMTDINGSRDIPRNWTCCPICGATRPKRNTLKLVKKNGKLIWRD